MYRTAHQNHLVLPVWHLHGIRLLVFHTQFDHRQQRGHRAVALLICKRKNKRNSNPLNVMPFANASDFSNNLPLCCPRWCCCDWRCCDCCCLYGWNIGCETRTSACFTFSKWAFLGRLSMGMPLIRCSFENTVVCVLRLEEDDAFFSNLLTRSKCMLNYLGKCQLRNRHLHLAIQRCWWIFIDSTLSCGRTERRRWSVME